MLLAQTILRPVRIRCGDVARRDSVPIVSRPYKAGDSMITPQATNAWAASLSPEEQPNVEAYVRERLTDVLPDFVSLQDYEEAVRILTEGRTVNGVWLERGDNGNYHPVRGYKALFSMDTVGEVGTAWLKSAAAHLKVKTDRYFRDRAPIKDEKAFMAMLKTMAQGYREGAQALEWAARRLKDTHHDAHGANETHKAAIVMARAAQELIGDE